MDKKVVLATRNKGKIAELKALLAGFGIEVTGLSEFPEIGEIPETGSSFEENALQKARTVSEATGLVALADDSGVVVDALGGAPGIFSARYAGEHATDEANNAKLLRGLEGVPREKRTARFVSVIAAWAPGGVHITARGEWEGCILEAPQGENGFGYDPLFLDPEAGMTAAQMAKEMKNARSHRGKALRKLLDEWPVFWSTVA